MNTNKIDNHLIHRIAMLAILFMAFVSGMWAEEANNLNIVSQDTHATGIDNGVVYLNDLEDHTWTYYSGVDASVDGGDYKTKYVGGAYNAGKLYSPNPRDVKITYTANGGAVSINEPETEFVYYKTLEQGKAENQYPYTVISNPFSKRPTGKGFGGWKICSGHNHIIRANGEVAEEYAILNLDEAITFVGLSTDTDNPTEIKFEATWEDADITYLTDVTGDYTFPIDKGGTYETNFLVLKCNPTKITLNSPCTIMMVEPDGSADYRSKKFTGNITPNNSGVTKIEYAHWNPSASINARGRNLTIGRGMVMDGTTKQTLLGSYTKDAVVNQILKIESGNYSRFLHYGENQNEQSSSNGIPGSIVKQWVTFGCDYDRAGADNNKLVIQGEMLVGRYVNLPTSSDKEICRVYSLSGNFMSNTSVSTGTTGDSYYLRVRGIANVGHVYMEILGGNWKGIAGGWGDADKHAPSTPAFTFRMRGGLLEGSLYGAGEYLGAKGTRTFVITGGTIKGWVAGGANGTRLDGGEMAGESFIYVGGNTQINSGASHKVINRAVGGNVFGAGCGYSATSTSGQVTLGTNVVIADDAFVERGVYGGGSYGYCATDKTSNIYITGGTIGGTVGGVNGATYVSSIKGGVYGGACQNKAGNVNIYMTDGTVNGGLYGGSNASGTLSGDVNIKITGGTIGGEMNGIQTYANVYGGGYGSGTIVNGSVNVTLDNIDASIETMINGDVYGGGAEGKVNKSISVNINDAAINGDLYGGGHGTNAKVTGSSTVNVSGGTINNVFGGGNAAELAGNSTVAITGGTVTGNVYGGGNEAAVSGTTKVVIGSSGQ